MKYSLVPSPDFVESLVVVEIATKEFTSPTGEAQSGTFRSMEEKISYLKQLGVNGIWLTGHQLCTPQNGLWSQYACVRPDRLDPTLGTEEDFKSLVATAHKNGIYLFVDVITHGVMPESDLITEHPDWFSGGSWGMVDYDWYGGHKDLDEWWVNTWVDQVLNYGIDGFRIDVSHYRSELWALIRKRCADAGHPIMVMMECGPSIPGVSDTHQHSEEVSDNIFFYPECRILKDCAGHFLDRQYNKKEQYTVEVHYKDGTVQKSYAENPDAFAQLMDMLQVRVEGSVMRHIDNDEYAVGYDEELCVLKLENVFQREIDDIVVYDYERHNWHLNKEKTLLVDYFVEVEGEAPSLTIRIPLRQQKGQYISIQLSCHDNGWEGFDGTNAFAAKGSRHVIGYGCMLAPGIPVFMAGEEFNADYRPPPGTRFTSQVNPDYDKMLWLYANWIDWEQLDIPEKKAMFEDTSKILAIRNENRHLVKAVRMGIKANVARLYARSYDVLPIPYIYLGDGEAIVVAANPSTEKDTELSFRFTDVLPYGERYTVTTLFGPEKTASGTTEELGEEVFKIARDKMPGGGLLVLKLKKSS